MADDADSANELAECAVGEINMKFANVFHNFMAEIVDIEDQEV